MENSTIKAPIGPQKASVFQDEDTIDIKKWLGKILSNWYYFGITCFIALAAAYVLNKRILPVNKIRATVIIENDNTSQSAMTSMLLGTNVMGAGNYYNSMIVLPSYSLIGRAADRMILELGVDYKKKTVIKESPYYLNAPIQVTFASMDPFLSSKSFELQDIDGESYRVYTEENENIGLPEFEGEFKYGEVVGNSFFTFQVDLTPNYELEKELGEEYKVIFTYRSRKSIQSEYNQRLQISDVIEGGGSVIEVSLESANPQRDVDFLTMLLDEFRNLNLDRKNEQATKTIDFIQMQLETIADSLAITETALEEFRTENQVMDISAQASALIAEVNDLEQEKSTLQVQNNYYEYLKEYLELDSNDELISPTTLGIEDINISRMVTELGEYQRKLNDYPKASPGYNIILKKFHSTKVALLETTKNILVNSEIALKNINERIELVQRDAKNLPATERQLLSIERKFKVNDSYYTFLLEKLSEAQITKASNTSDNVVLDPPMVTERVNKNKKKINYAIALILGLFFPFVVIVANDMLDVRVRSKEDIEGVTDKPILGMLMRTNKEGKVLTYKYPKSAFAEAFRSLRTRIDFMAKDKDKISMMVTSSLPGEGKSFISINIAGVFGLKGKKTILLGFDLRKPKATSYLGIEADKGLSNYLAGQVELQDIIKRPESANFDFIPSGTIPPNPGELMSSEKMKALFDYVKSNYDVVIVDTPPTGVVSDGLWISPFVDMNLFVVRHRYTDKHLLKEVLENAETNNLKGISLIVNDVIKSKERIPFLSRYVLGGKYGYSYNYGYGYNYGYIDSGYVEE